MRGVVAKLPAELCVDLTDVGEAVCGCEQVGSVGTRQWFCADGDGEIIAC